MSPASDGNGSGFDPRPGRPQIPRTPVRPERAQPDEGRRGAEAGRSREETTQGRAATGSAVERACSDYLAVSRSARLYSDPAAYERSEAEAWERLGAALAEAAGAPRPDSGGPA